MITEKLKPLEKESQDRKIPIIGPEKGQYLLQIVKEIKPIHILELGTANGYSGIILTSEGAELTTIELDPKIAQEATQNFEKYRVDVNIIVGDGVEEVKKLAENSSNQDKFDIIFIDFAKKKYINVLENCIKLVRVGGYIIADNITMEGCSDYKEKVLNHLALSTEIINIKDGLACSQRVY